MKELSQEKKDLIISALRSYAAWQFTQYDGLEKKVLRYETKLTKLHDEGMRARTLASEIENGKIDG